MFELHQFVCWPVTFRYIENINIVSILIYRIICFNIDFIYRRAQFLVLRVDLLFLDSNVGNKEFPYKGQIDCQLSAGNQRFELHVYTVTICTSIFHLFIQQEIYNKSQVFIQNRNASMTQIDLQTSINAADN